MAFKYVQLVWHHGGEIVHAPEPAYITQQPEKCYERVDTDLLSYFELRWYVKSLGYQPDNCVVYYKRQDDARFTETTDESLVDLAKKVVDGEQIHLYIDHLIGEPQLLEQQGDDVVVDLPPP